MKMSDRVRGIVCRITRCLRGVLQSRLEGPMRVNSCVGLSDHRLTCQAITLVIPLMYY